MDTQFTAPVRVGIVGLGRAGWGQHCPELDQYPNLFQIVAVCDPVKERRDLAVAKYHCQSYRRFQDLLADHSVELVDIATVSDGHLDQALAGLGTGKWVQVEPPMCRTYDEALVLRAAAIKARHRLVVRQNRRFEPGFQQVREVIASGMLGEIYDIKIRQGRFQRRDDWQTVKRCTGGLLLHEGPHYLDQALQILGATPAKIWADLKRVAATGDAEDYVHILLRNADGLTIDLEISGGRILPEPEYAVTGSRGALAYSSGDALRLRYLDAKHKLSRRRASVRTPPLGPFGTPENLKWSEESIPVNPKTPCGLTKIWEHLFATIRQNRPFPVTIDQAIETMRIITAARKDTPFA
jgi:predicted dehydrogenase